MSEDLKFRGLRLTGWKNFARVEVPVQDRVFLVGPNASGKSNFLDLFRFLRDLASSGGGFQEAVARRGGVRAIRALSARRGSDVEIRVELRANKSTSWAYELAFGQDRRREALVRSERVVRDGEVLLDRPDDQDLRDPERLTQTALEQVNVNREFRELVTFFESIRYLHVVPQLVREPDRSAGRSNDPFGGDFVEQIARTPARTRDARLRRIEAALRAAVPQLEEIELWRDVHGTPRLRGKHRQWRSREAWQTEDRFSDGMLRLIGLLWAAMENHGPLLLEEPELGLHPEIVRFLPQMLARVQRRTGRQIFLSTHSPDLLRDDGIGLDEVLLLLPGPEGTEVTPVDSHPDARDLLEGGLTLADVVIPKTRPAEAGKLTVFGDD